MSNVSLADLTFQLAQSTRALAALGVVLSQRAGRTVETSIASAAEGVVAAMGATEAVINAPAAEVAIRLAEIRTMLNQSAQLAAEPAAGWMFTESQVLQDQGDISAPFAAGLARLSLQLDDLAFRLAGPFGSFLDVGVGVGSLAIALARQWPSLRVVGIDPWESSLAIANERVRSAEVADRITLRQQRVEDLSDEAAFDAVWFSGPFVGHDVIPAALRQVKTALRPGGWIFFGTLNREGGDLSAALADLWTVYWGGQPIATTLAEDWLHSAGYAEVQSFPSPPAAIGAFTVGQRSK